MSLLKGSLALGLSIILAACGGGGGGDSETTSNGAVAVTKRLIEANATCPSGGVDIDMGVDTNKNGQLDADEISSTETICNGANGSDGSNGTSAAVRLTASTDASCPFGGTNIEVGIDTNANGALDDAEVLDTSLICHAQSSVVASDFALSAKGKVAGQLDLALIPVPKSSDGFSVQSRSRSITSRKVTSQAGTLWLTPNDIAAAIQADQVALDQANNNPGSDTQITPPVIAPIEIPVAADGSYSIDVPAGTDYSLTYVSDDATQAIKIDDVNVTPNKETTLNIAQQDLLPAGAVNFVVQSLANNSPIESATVTLLNDATSTSTDASGAASFEGLAQGSYTLLVAQSGFVSQTFAVQITSGQTLDLGVLQINSEKGSASGILSVDVALLTSLENIVVYARDARGGIYTTLTDASGAFSFNALPVANGYSFIAQANDFSVDKITDVNITANTNTEVDSIELKAASAFVGAISGFAKFNDKLAVLNSHAGLLVAVEGTDKEAVTGRDGAFILNDLSPGRYTLNFTDSNYQTTTLENIRVVSTATTSLDPVALQLRTGQVSGVVALDGQLSSAGILIEILGTTSKTFTDNSGRWFLNLPTGNYGNGIRYSANLFESKTIGETISVIESGEYQAGAQVLAQQGKQLSLDLSAVGGSCSSLQVALAGTSGAANGYTALFTVEGGTLEQDLVFGDYTLTASCVDAGFETVVTTLNVAAGNGLITTLNPIALRVSFVAINLGALYTNDANVTLNIGAVGASEMQITQGSFDSGWITLAETYALALDAGDGTKTVLIHLRDDAQQPLSDVSASIELDTTITVASFTATGASTKNETLHLKLDLSGETDATVTATIPGLVNGLVLFDNGLNGDVSANDGVYERNLDITTPNEITATATASIADRAGNTATQDAANGIVLSTNPSISAVSVSSNVASGEMTIRFSTDEPATSSINYGTDSAALNTSLPVEALLTQNHTITLTNLPPNQLTFFELLATDNATNVGSFNGQGKLAPAPIGGLNAAAGSAEVGLVWEASSHSELAGYNVYRSADGGNSFNILNAGAVITERYLVDSSATNEISYQYYVTVLDVDGNESIASASVEVTPSSGLAGPTQMNGGVISTGTIWLSSRSPYLVSDNMLIRENGSLLLMAGTTVQFEGGNKHILVKGIMQAYGSENNRVAILSDPLITEYENQSAIIHGRFFNEETMYYSSNPLTSNFNYTDVSYIKIYVENESVYGRNVDPVNLTLNFSNLKLRYSANGESSEFAIKEVSNSIVTIEDCLSYFNAPALIERIFNTSVNIQAGNTCSTQDGGHSGDYILQYGGYGLKSKEVVGGSVNAINIFVALSLESTLLANSNVFNEGGLRANKLQMDNSHIALQGSNSKLTLNNSVLDASSTVSAKYLDVASNYWGTVNFSSIAERTNYFPAPLYDTHLYPIITSSDLKNADFDNDGIPDIRDHDNDNDGYSDLQEDWTSDPAYGSIYNPLDAASHPSAAIDSDMDGIADANDTDDDNDNLTDTEEYIYGTNPLLADSDNDGSLDGDEVSHRYDPLDDTNYPYLGTVTGITIDGTNVNSDGVVYFSGQAVTLNNVAVLPGVKLMVDRDTTLSFYYSNLLGHKNNPIFIRSSGSGSGNVSFHNSQVSYANIRLSLGLSIYGTVLDYCDVEINKYSSVSGGGINNSYLRVAQSFTVLGGALLRHVYGDLIQAPIDISDGILTGSRIKALTDGYGANIGMGGLIEYSVVDRSYVGGVGKIENSIVGEFTSWASASVRVLNSDLKLPDYNSDWGVMFEGSYIRSYNNNFYDGLGSPEDLIGDGLLSSEFLLDGRLYTVDGIKNPRSTPNFPNGESDLWDPNGVGVLWDKNNPDTFPDPLAP